MLFALLGFIALIIYLFLCLSLYFRDAANASLAAVRKRQMVMHKKYHGQIRNPSYFVWPSAPVVASTNAVDHPPVCSCEKIGTTEYQQQFVKLELAERVKPINPNHCEKNLNDETNKSAVDWVSVYDSCFVDPRKSQEAPEVATPAGLSIPRAVTPPHLFAWKRAECPNSAVVCAEEPARAAPTPHASQSHPTAAPTAPGSNPYFYAWELETDPAGAAARVSSEFNDNYCARSPAVLEVSVLFLLLTYRL